MSFLTDNMKRLGKLPPVGLTIQPLGSGALGKPFVLNRFLSYEFNSSVLVPVDSFKFSTVMPDDTNPITNYTREGDIVILQANGVTISTGLIDRLDIEYDITQGEKIDISGRNLMAQFEDQDAVSLDAKPLYGDNLTPAAMLNSLLTDTRIPGFTLTDDAPIKPYLFATEPGESKLQALSRYMEALNCIAWMSPNGKIVFGRPHMNTAPLGNLFVVKKNRTANVTSIRVSRNATQIPNIIVPIWAGQETVQSRVTPEQVFYNNAVGPTRLRKLGHRLPKAYVISTPQGASPQELAEVNRLTVGSGNLIQAVGKRETARANVREMEVEVVVPGHYNDNGDPYLIDTVYTVTFDRGDINGVSMYLYEVTYTMDPEGGQKTVLKLCNLGTIVSDIKAP